MAPSLLLMFTITALFSPFMGGVSGEGVSFYSEIQQLNGEDIFTSGAQDPAKINSISIDDVWDKVKKIPDLPKEILGAVLDAIFFVINGFADLAITVAETIENTVYSVFLSEDMENQGGMMVTAVILLTFVRVIALLAIIRLWVWILNVIPVI